MTQSGLQRFLVGGAVRDRLLGIEPRERDWVVVGATVEQMEKLGYRRVGRDFPVFLHPETGEEHALARTERKSGHGYRGFDTRFTPDVTLEEDLQRRDLTINAMALTDDGALIDPYGGRRDLEQRRLRHVSAAFAEDPLRVLRVARFLARFDHLGFRIDPSTLELMRAITAAGELEYLAPERVWTETERAMGEPGPDAFVRALRDSHALARLFPEIDRLFGIPQTPKYHPEIDTGEHILLALRVAARLTPDPQVRFAVLVHDLGKGTTPAELLPRHHGHEERGVALVTELARRLGIPTRYADLGRLTSRYHLLCHRAPELRGATLEKLLSALDAWRRPQRLEQFLLACEADGRGRLGREEQPYPGADFLRHAYAAACDIDSRDLAQQFSGARLGEAIRNERVTRLEAFRAEQRR